MSIDHSPCVTDEQVAMRLVVDQKEIQQMIREGHSVKAMVAWHSPVTLETHCLPVFASDTLEDIINRYFDFFPKECLATIADCEEISKTLFNGTGMSEAQTIMSSFKIPLGLWKLLESWEPGFFAVDPKSKGFQNKKLINRFLGLMPKLRTKTPYGQRIFQVA